MNVTCGRAKGLKKVNKEYQYKLENEAIKDANMAYDPNEYGWHSRYSGFEIGATFGYTEGKEAAFRAVVELIREVSTQEQDIFSKNDYVRYLLANKDRILVDK